jgi:hypothetical protein
MKLSTRPLLLLLFFTFQFSACTSGPKSKLFSSEKIWEESGINNYQISIQVIQSIWHLQIYNLTVKNGLVIDSSTSCIPAPYEGRECTIKSFDPNEFTIPALFSLAEQQIKSQQSKWVKLDYDPDFGFPTMISFNDPDILDEDWSYQVISFTKID